VSIAPYVAESRPPGAAEPAAPDRTGRRVVALFQPYRGRVLLIAVAIVGSSALGVVVPFLTQAIFDRALFPRLADGSTGAPRLGLLGALVGVSVAITLVSALIGVWQTYLTTELGNRVMRDLRDRLFAHLQRMDLGFFTSTRTGEIQAGSATTSRACRRSSPTPPRRSSATRSQWCRRWWRCWCCRGD